MGFLSGVLGDVGGLIDPLVGAATGFLASGGNPLGALAGGAIGGSLAGATAAQGAANTQSAAANNATATQYGMFNTIQGNMSPYMTQGAQSLGQLGGYMNANQNGGPGGQPGLLHQFGAADLTANLSPNYQFQLGQGMGMLQNQNAAAGGAGGGNAFTGEQSYAQNTAQNAYQQAYSNYQTNQQNVYNRLGNLAQLGQASGTNTALGGSAFAGGMSNTIVGSANAQAAGQVGVTNALTGGVSNALPYLMLGNLGSSAMQNNINAGNAAYSSGGFVGPNQYPTVPGTYQ